MADCPSHTLISLDELERVPLEAGIWRPIRRKLGVTAFGINAYTADRAGDPLVERHDERSAGAGGHEELYVTMAGTARFVIAGEEIDVPAGSAVLVGPGTMREAVAGNDATTVLVLGGRPGSAMPPSPFEYWYSAIPAERTGQYEQAYAIAAEGLEHYPEHGTLHYALACLAAQLGRTGDALDHLRIAFANDPRTREWAAEDEELDSIRGEPDYPG